MKNIAKYYQLLNGDLLFLSIIVPQLMWFLLKYGTYYEDTVYANLPNQICVSTMIFCFFSLVRHTAIFNPTSREPYLAVRPSSLKGDLIFLFSEKLFWIRVLIFISLYFLLPLDWTFKALADLASGNVFIVKSILCATALLIAVLAHLSAYHFLSYAPQNENYSKKRDDKISTIISAAYIFGAYFLTVAIPGIINLWPMLRQLLSVELIIIIVILLLLPSVYRIIRAWRKRQSFIKELKKTCAAKEISLSEIHTPYRSIFRLNDGENFHIVSKGKKYSCKLICGFKRRVPLAIYKSGILSFLHRIRFRGVTFLQYEVRHTIAYETDCQKLLIINPTPKKVFMAQEPKMTEIDNGQTIGEYKIFTASGFFRALEMDVLDK